VRSTVPSSLSLLGELGSGRSFDRPVDRRTAHREQVGDLCAAVLACLDQLDHVRASAILPTLGGRPFRRPLVLASRMPSAVRPRTRAVWKSATISNTGPRGSLGSWTDPPRCRMTPRLARSATRSLASDTERASRSRLITTNVSPARHAIACPRPGRGRVRTAQPHVGIDPICPDPAAVSAARWATRSAGSLPHRA